MTTTDVLPEAPAGGPAPGLTPLRKGLLAVGVAGSLFAIGFGVLNMVGWMARTTSVDRYDLSSPAQDIRIDASGGSIVVAPSEDGQVHLTATSRYSLSKPSIERHVDGSGIRVSSECTGFNLLNCSVDFELQVPASYAVRAHSGGGRIEASGLSGRVELETGGGRIEVRDLSGPVVLDTGGGRIEGDNLTGPTASADTGGGDIDLVFAGTAVTSVRATSGGGDVTVAVPSSVEYRVDAASGGGHVDVAIPSDPDAANSVLLRSGGGDVSVVPAA